jgi:uncharacterized protein YqeY
MPASCHDRVADHRVAGVDVPARLRLALRDALTAKDTVTVSVLRSVLSAISNAEAVDAVAGPGTSGPYIAAAAGVGAAEAPRRVLSPADVAGIVRVEVRERLSAAAAYERAGQHGPAERLRAEVRALTLVLPDAGG